MHKALLVFLVDTIVGQVDEVVAQLGRVVGVLVRGKPDQLLSTMHLSFILPDKAFLVEVDLDRVNSGEKNVESKVEFTSIDQQRVVNVLLHAHLALLVRYLL